MCEEELNVGQEPLTNIPAEVVEAYEKVLSYCRTQDEVSAMTMAVGVMATKWKLCRPQAYDYVGQQVTGIHNKIPRIPGNHQYAEVWRLLSHVAASWMGLAMNIDAMERSRNNKS